MPATENQTNQTTQQQPVVPQVISSQPSVDIEAVRAEAARKERDAWQAKMTEERKAREDLEAKLSKIEEERKEAAMKKLPPDERIQAQIRELQEAYQKTAKQLENERLFFNNQIQAINLVAYRERALRDAGQEVIPELVVGVSEAEIDAALDASKSVYKRVQAEFAAKYGRPLPGNDFNGSIPLNNPAYPVSSNDANAGLPTPINPVVVQGLPQGEMPMDIKDLTSEEAVRSGRYSGEMRRQLHGMLKSMGAPRNPGWDSPRYLQNNQVVPPTPMQYVQQPGGVMQPVGSPNAPAINPQMVQQQRLTPAQVEQQKAQQAIQRTNSGQNPLLSQNSGATTVLADAMSYAAGTGVNAQGAFATRFANSPPVQQQPSQQK